MSTTNADTEQQHRLSKLKNQYDVAVVGGGVYGAATAWEAASRGLSVVLIEAKDFCSGTSANSLKTIHGGLRSLQRFDFPEMREYIRERRALLRIAPHLVTPMQCVIPTYSKFSKSRFFLGMGMKLYDLIAYDRNRGLDTKQQIQNTQIISAERFRELAPELDSADITGGARWFDAQAFNSERMVLAYVMSAKKAGADVFNYTRKKNYIANQGAITGLVATDQLTGVDIEISAKAVVDCCGPWAARDDVFISTTQKMLQPKLMARAVNLVVDRELSSCAVGIKSNVQSKGDSGLMFIAPWRKGSIVGTWYYPPVSSGSASSDSDTTDSAAKENKLTLSDEEFSQCLQQINSVLPSRKLNRKNITQIHLGLQPAVLVDSHSTTGGGKVPELWRHTRIIDSSTGTVSKGLFWILGVKLTTARATAESVIDKVADYLCADVTPSKTSITALYGGDVIDGCHSEKERIKNLSNSLSEETITRLYKNYGSNIKYITDICEKDLSLIQLVPGLDDTIKAELKFIIEHEVIYTLSDLLLRRTDIGSFECPTTETIEYCSEIMAEYFQWQDQQRIENIHQLLQQYPTWH
jgi:glycerol-3-phosphate dehydrogenase